MKLVPCRPSRRELRTSQHQTVQHNNWRMSAPFAVNPRGVLVHRVRSARTFFRDGAISHHCASYWCGNSGYSVVFTDNPPADRLLCVFCEARAVASGEEPADALAGRHIHKGRVKARRTCCDLAEVPVEDGRTE